MALFKKLVSCLKSIPIIFFLRNAFVLMLCFYEPNFIPKINLRKQFSKFYRQFFLPKIEICFSASILKRNNWYSIILQFMDLWPKFQGKVLGGGPLCTNRCQKYLMPLYLIKLLYPTLYPTGSNTDLIGCFKMKKKTRMTWTSTCIHLHICCCNNLDNKHKNPIFLHYYWKSIITLRNVEPEI